jgi:hypothetical protein
MPLFEGEYSNFACFLQWKNRFENASVDYHFEGYLEKPDTTILWFRNTSELSYLFWGNVRIVARHWFTSG